MPVSIQKTHGKYRVSTPHGTKAFGTTKKNAERQARLLRAVDHGWHPTGKAAKESVHDQAERVVDRLLEVDEIGSVPIPASGKAYARIHGMRGLRNKQRLYINMSRDLGNRGKTTQGFPNREGSEYTGKHEAMDNAPASAPLERHHTEKTTMGGGKYGKGVDPKSKTSGKFKMPDNWSVGHAMKA